MRMEKLRDRLAKKPLWLRKLIAIAIISLSALATFLLLIKPIHWRFEIAGVKGVWLIAIAPTAMVIIFAVLFIRWQPDDE